MASILLPALMRVPVVSRYPAPIKFKRALRSGLVILLGFTVFLLALSGCGNRDAASANGRYTGKTRACFGCNAQGVVPCHVSSCFKGNVECAATCLKLSRGNWVHLEVAGHDPKELWQKFPDGPGKWTAWSQGHVGELIVVKDGKARNAGVCQDCKGRTTIPCTECKGKTLRPCDFCDGTRKVPADWKENDNPVLNRQPDLIRLRDGRALLGKVTMRLGTRYTIRTRKGETFEVNAGDILPKTNSVSQLTNPTLTIRAPSKAKRGRA